ncbi:uncharacterized protein LOC119443920 [Dermacentor silvarum]|uniref:uncharacterized protein LOC119443920 n=1 Tax=Dermacentor silvarum TaxID=543639 RepID=UPI0021008855|nr:uncharacterized protein LOC119443920 [Dermacentor silvarum]
MPDRTRCQSCLEKLPGDGRFLTCLDCKLGYHLGKHCSGVAENTFTSMGVAKREAWKCKQCRTLASDNSLLTAHNPEGTAVAGDPGSFAKELNALREELRGIKDMMVVLLPLQEKLDELLAMKPKIDEVLSVKETVVELQNSVQFLSSAYDTVVIKTKESDSTLKCLETQVVSLTETVNAQSTEILQLRADINGCEQYNRLSNLELHGLPLSPGENLRTTIADLAQKLEILDFEPRDVVAIHRLPARKDKTPIVLIRFSSPFLRDSWLAARGKLRALAQKKNIPAMYLNENLTQATKELFWKTRSKGKENNYKFVWVRNAKIFARKEDWRPCNQDCIRH